MGAIVIMPALIPMQSARPRVTSRSRRSRRRQPARRLAGVTVRAQLTHLGVGAIERAFVSVFGHMKGHVCKRGSRSRQTQVMVCRLHSSSEPVGRHGRIAIYEGEDGYIGGRLRWAWGPPSLCSHGPGEPSGGSVRPRGRSLRPDGVWTAPRARGRIRGGVGCYDPLFCKPLAGRTVGLRL